MSDRKLPLRLVAPGLWVVDGWYDVQFDYFSERSIYTPSPEDEAWAAALARDFAQFED